MSVKVSGEVFSSDLKPYEDEMSFSRIRNYSKSTTI